MTPYPEHNKLRAVAEIAQAQGEFLEWLKAKGYELAEWTKDGNDNDRLSPVHVPLSTLSAEYHDIDLTRLEEEKRAILKAHRELLDPLEKF